MNNITRRSLIVSGAALASGSMLLPAEASTGQISLRIVSAGFIFGASGGSGVLTFQGRQYPAVGRRHQRRRDNRGVGHGPRRHCFSSAHPG